MKKLFLLLALMGMVAVGCSKDDIDKGNDNKTEQPNEDEGGNIPDEAYISLDKEIVTISPDGESVGVKVYSNYAWELTNNCDWITTSITSGDASDTGVTVTLTADLTYDDREGTIVFSCGNAKKLLVVSQKFKEAIISDANNTFNIPVEGGVAILNYQTSVDCEVIIPEEAQDWITIAPATRGLVAQSATLHIAENTTYGSRSAVIKVVAKDNAELVVEYTINQEQKNGVLVDGNNTFNVSGAGGSVVIEYQANVDCEVIIPDEAQDWITIVPATRGLSTYSTTLNIAENNSGKERSCVVKVTSQGDNELSAKYTIIQNPRCFLYYTSNDGEIVYLYRSSSFDATILSNTYIDGVGVIEFNAPITKIGDSAFEYCSSLTSVTIPDSVTEIVYAAFYGCKSLTSVTIPDSVTSIGEHAFYGCKSLTSVYISDIAAWCNISFSEWASNPLYYANNLYLNNELVTDLTIPDSVTTIGDRAFYNCTNLTNVTIPDSVTMIGEWAFGYCSSLTSITIPDIVTTIGYGAFAGCNGLKEFKGKFASEDGRYLIIDGTLNSFAPAGLTEYVIPDSVTTIGDYAFYGCSSLTSVTIPDSVTEIGYVTFAICENLNTVYCKAINPPTTIVYNNGYWFGFAKEDESGYICNIGCTIYVPTESVNKYKSADGWNEYASDIVGYNF
ncbi:MAG: leucine-rich repeat protein [Alistipes sp.]|nr:leucine-rich repeat protein [Alistipes sp.]